MLPPGKAGDLRKMRAVVKRSEGIFLGRNIYPVAADRFARSAIGEPNPKEDSMKTKKQAKHTEGTLLIHNPSYPCVCEVSTHFCHKDGGRMSYEIKYCSTHSAAPELLEATKQSLKRVEWEGRADDQTLIDVLYAAIAKATGEGR